MSRKSELIEMVKDVNVSKIILIEYYELMLKEVVEVLDDNEFVNKLSSFDLFGGCNGLVNNLLSDRQSFKDELDRLKGGIEVYYE